MIPESHPLQQLFEDLVGRHYAEEIGIRDPAVRSDGSIDNYGGTGITTSNYGLAMIDYGVQVRPSDDDLGTTRYVSGPVKTPSDWEALPSVAPDRGVLAQQVEVVRRVRADTTAY